MLRIPAKGPPLYACLCASAALAVISFWLNAPDRSLSQKQIRSAARRPATSQPATNELFASDKIRALLNSREAGDPALMQALENLASDDDALPAGCRLLREHPGRAQEIGTILIGALIRASHHAAALELAQSGPEDCRAEWLQLILSHWARTEPDAGNLIVDQLRQNAVGIETFALVAKNWAASAPAELARYALALPAGPYRSTALAATLDPWLQQDPAAVANCLVQLAEPVERNLISAALASRTDTALRPTSQGLRWAESITDPEMRRDALSHVVREWSASDPAAALRYLSASPDFNPEQRQTLLAALAPRPEPF